MMSAKVKEKIAQAIGDKFTTNEIVNIFANARITTDLTVGAKWRMALDAFNRISTEEGFFHILNEFCHPLNFQEKEARLKFIEKISVALFYEDIEVKTYEKKVEFILKDEKRDAPIRSLPEVKTSTDHIVDALNFFKDEYNKVKITGIAYEYPLGENIESDQVEDGKEDYDEKLQAIEQLKRAGFITEYEIVNRVECKGYYIWDYAVCKIDESKLTQKEKPKATDVGVNTLVKKIIHEHTYKFENNFQEKEKPIQKIEIVNGKIEVDGLKNGLEAIAQNNKKADGPKFLYKLPAGTKWEDITIKFESDENVFIKAKRFEHYTNFKDMGFIGKGNNPKSSEAWLFLRVLSMAKVAGEIVITDQEAKEKWKAQKGILAEGLQSYFSIDYDPFYPYRSSTEKLGSSYKIKINLVPSPEKENKEYIAEEKDEIKEYLTQEAPQVYDD